jgi:hypothetical protein
MIRNRSWIGWLLGLLLCTPACDTIGLKPIVEDSGEEFVKLGQEMEYYEYLREKPRASTADGARLIALMAGLSPWYREPKDLKDLLLDHGIVRPEWEISDAAPLTAGKIAYMVCRAAKIDTSVIMHLTVPSERYSMREAVFHKIMQPSSIYRYVSGAKLLDIISKTMDYQEKRSAS